jgi:uncharacterized protein (TIGR02147 family)
MERPNLYAHDDYRKALQAWMDFWIETQKSSQRGLARAAEISNPGYLNDVVQGRRTLSRSVLQKLGPVFDWDSKEIEFFRLLVEFGQAKNHEEKEEVLRQLNHRRSRSQFARIHAPQVKYYQDPKYSLVRCALEAFPVTWKDVEKLGKSIVPPIAPAATKKILEDLLAWEMIQLNPQGVLTPNSRFVEPAPTLGLQVRRMNQNWLKDAAEGIELWDREERHISTILMAVSEQTAQQIRSKVELLRKEIFELLEQDHSPERMYQLSLALLPRQQAKES